VSGAFLSSAYFDLAWLYYALTAILGRELRTSSVATSMRQSISATPVGGPSTARTA